MPAEKKIICGARVLLERHRRAQYACITSKTAIYVGIESTLISLCAWVGSPHPASRSPPPPPPNRLVPLGAAKECETWWRRWRAELKRRARSGLARGCSRQLIKPRPTFLAPRDDYFVPIAFSQASAGTFVNGLCRCCISASAWPREAPQSLCLLSQQTCLWRNRQEAPTPFPVPCILVDDVERGRAVSY